MKPCSKYYFIISFRFDSVSLLLFSSQFYFRFIRNRNSFASVCGGIASPSVASVHLFALQKFNTVQKKKKWLSFETAERRWTRGGTRSDFCNVLRLDTKRKKHMCFSSNISQIFTISRRWSHVVVRGTGAATSAAATSVRSFLSICLSFSSLSQCEESSVYVMRMHMNIRTRKLFFYSQPRLLLSPPFSINFLAIVLGPLLSPLRSISFCAPTSPLFVRSFVLFFRSANRGAGWTTAHTTKLTIK